MSATPLFQSQPLSLDEAVRLLERQLDKKCDTWAVSFGVFKGLKGISDHNALLVITDKAGKHYNKSFRDETFSGMMHQANEFLSTLKP